MSGKITGTEPTVAVTPEPRPGETPGGPRRAGEGETLTPATAASPRSITDASATVRAVVAGRYEVLGLVGAGGMGTVYRARDRELDEPVALKMLRREVLEQPWMLDRFRQEVKLARRVTHTNVARTFDIGEHEGEKFLTMELVDGESLATRIAREGALPLGAVVAIGSGVCAGLEAAHAAGVVHRDLKPDNVLLGRDGRVVITDFGIARALFDASRAATVGTAVGTPAYMSPEQIEGATDIDGRADVYALGAMLYECLTGERAWSADSVWAIAAARLVNLPPDPRALRPDVPEAAAALVLRCMARRREDRFATAAEVAGALASLSLPVPVARHASNAPPAAPMELDAKALAVLPFRNLGAAEDEYLADGLSDDLIDALSMTPGLRVLSRGAVARFRGPDRDAREVGRELRVPVVVEGSVRRVGTLLRVSARVVGVADGFQIWARRFDRPEREALAVSDEVANAVADALTVRRSAAARVVPSDSRAVDLYLRARHALAMSWRTDAAAALALFEQALALAPDDPTILAGYARAQLRTFGFDMEGTSAPQAESACRTAAEHALAVAPQAGEPRAVLANLEWMLGNHKGCARELREAVRLAPSSSDVNALYGRFLLETGEPERGVACLDAAVALDPQVDFANDDLMRGRALLGDWSAVEAGIERPIETEGSGTPRVYLVARLIVWKRDRAMADAFRERVQAAEFTLKPQVLVALAVFREGFPAELVRKELGAWGRGTGRARRRPLLFRQIAAEMAMFLGDREAALAAIEASDAMGLLDVTWVDRCPLLADLRGDPRFQEARDSIAARAREALDILEGRTA